MFCTASELGNYPYNPGPDLYSHSDSSVSTVNQEENHDTVCFLILYSLKVNASLNPALEPSFSIHTLSFLVNNLFYWLQCDYTISDFSTAEHSCSCWLLIPYVSSKLYNSLF